jgi:hypothetical protein
MKVENAGYPRWGSGCTRYWPPFVSLCRSLWVALTRLSGFRLQTLSYYQPLPTIEGPVGDTDFVSLVGGAGVM